MQAQFPSALWSSDRCGDQPVRQEGPSEERAAQHSDLVILDEVMAKTQLKTIKTSHF